MSDVKTQEQRGRRDRQRLRLQGQQPQGVLCQGRHGLFDRGGGRHAVCSPMSTSHRMCCLNPRP